MRCVPTPGMSPKEINCQGLRPVAVGFSALWSYCPTRRSQGQSPLAVVFPSTPGRRARPLPDTAPLGRASFELIFFFSVTACMCVHTCTHSFIHQASSVFLFSAALALGHREHPTDVVSLLGIRGLALPTHLLRTSERGDPGRLPVV